MPAIHRVGPSVAYYGNPNITGGEGMQFLGFTRGNVTLSPNVNIVTGKVDQVGMAPLAESVWSSGAIPTITLPLIDEDKEKFTEYILGSGPQTTVSGWTANSSNTGVLTQPTITIVGYATPGTYTLGATTGGGTSAARYTLSGPPGTSTVSGITSTGTSGGAVRIGTLTVTTNLAANDAWEFTVGEPSWGLGSGYTKVAKIGTLALIPVDELSQGINGVDAMNGVWFPSAICTNFGDLVYNLPEGDDSHQPHEATVQSTYLEFDARPDTEGDPDNTGTDRILLPTSHRQMFIGSPGSITAQTLGSDTYQAPAWTLPALSLPIHS